MTDIGPRLCVSIGPWWLRLRFWLIRKLAGNSFVLLNTSIHGGKVFVHDAPILICGNTILDVTFQCETLEVNGRLQLALFGPETSEERS